MLKRLIVSSLALLLIWGCGESPPTAPDVTPPDLVQEGPTAEALPEGMLLAPGSQCITETFSFSTRGSFVSQEYLYYSFSDLFEVNGSNLRHYGMMEEMIISRVDGEPFTVQSVNWLGYAPTLWTSFSGRVAMPLGGWQLVSFGLPVPTMRNIPEFHWWSEGDGGRIDDLVLCVADNADNIPPEISFELDATELWPSNHKMVTVATGISATDNLDPNPTVTVSVISDEDEDGTGDGDTSPDWVITDNGDGTFDVAVRAEAAGNGDGRVYTITVTATDATGNTATEVGTVSVPHDKRKGKGK